MLKVGDVFSSSNVCNVGQVARHTTVTRRFDVHGERLKTTLPGSLCNVCIIIVLCWSERSEAYQNTCGRMMNNPSLVCQTLS